MPPSIAPAQPEPTAEIPHSAKPATTRKPKLKLYGFDVTGTLYDSSKYPGDKWEALKKKLGTMIEVEAANQGEAWKEYENRKGKQ